MGRAVTLILLVATPAGCGVGTAVLAPPTTTTPTTPTTAPTPTTTTTTTTSTTTTPGPVVLGPGGTGAEVTAVQSRLAALGYWLGPADGTYGDLTRQAVLALQKTAGLPRDGLLGPTSTDALARGLHPLPRSRSGRVVEVDITRQLVLVVTDGRLEAALNASTGNGQTYYVSGVAQTAVTPNGRYRIFRRVDGWDTSPLGALWRPGYFSGGVAIHGYGDVPAYPASHGCVRIGIAAMDWIWSTGLVPVGTAVWVY